MSKKDIPYTIGEGRKSVPVLSSTEKILEERGKRYGEFKDHARLTQDLKLVMQNFKSGDPWAKLDGDMQEALQMIQHKIGRILNGDPNYEDSWADIAGYAELVAKRLRENKTN